MAGGKNSGSKKKVKEPKREPTAFVVKAFLGFAVAVLVAAFVGALLQRRAAARKEADLKHLELLGTKMELQNKLSTMMTEMQKVEEQRSAAEKEAAAEGKGPGLMQAQASMITKLLTLVQKVDELKGDDNREERLAVSKRVEEELVELEVSVQEQAGTAIGKQQAGLIALVRDALRSDRDGTDMNEDWNEEQLRQKHGLVTYATPAYWEDAYSGGRYGDSFEWYGGWADDDLKGKSLGSVMKPSLNIFGKTLMLGCGNSNMSKLMHDDGFGDITSVDISEKVIEQMKEKYGEVKGLDWQVQDASQLDFADASFDAVVEKGMFDSLYAGTGERVQAVLSEVLRVMKPGSTLISVSFSGDRVDRLFHASKDDSAPGLACSTADEMAYRAANPGDDADESKQIYVYACKRV